MEMAGGAQAGGWWICSLCGGRRRRTVSGAKSRADSSDHVRSGAYCAMVIISLLALPLDLPPNAPARGAGLTSFTDGLPQYLSRCKCDAGPHWNPQHSCPPGQTYEGGVSGAPQTEAHGAYAFCVLACLCILGPPQEMIPT